MKMIRIFLLVLGLGSLFTACVSTKELTKRSQYFREISDSLLQKSSIEYEPVFQKGDILSITVITPNENSARLFNQATVDAASMAGEQGSASMSAPSNGYLINEKGVISFPFLGHIKTEGYTRMAFTDTLTNRLRRYIDSPTVSIRFMNYRVTVLGEVMRPGAFSIPSERVTVLDAIGLAGDLTIYGKRNNIRVIRNVNGVRQTGLLDLNKGDIFGSPFFYLRQNDIVYVEMNDRKIPNTDQATLRNISIGLGIISAIGVIASVINVLQ